MFQLVMSHIHAKPQDDRYDTDSCVGNIEDGLVAIQAFWSYVAKLSADFGIDFVLYDPNVDGALSNTTVLTAKADFPNSHGGATIWVELQAPAPQNDVDRILTLMRTKAHYSNLEVR
jgi:hypothetical protein